MLFASHFILNRFLSFSLTDSFIILIHVVIARSLCLWVRTGSFLFYISIYLSLPNHFNVQLFLAVHCKPWLFLGVID